ncbi:MAG: 2-thiouracil desulfurase family protein [Candidatus Methanospirareceae archaeon]
MKKRGKTEREYVLVSLCLLGVPCRYHGKTHRMGHRIGRPQLIAKLREQYNLLPLCPEQLGGLPTPRSAARVIGKKVIAADGKDVTMQYLHGTELVLRLCRLFDVKKAYLLRDSPACGKGYGITARRLESEGIQVVKA